MTAGVGFKFTVHFSTSFSTTRTSFRHNGTVLSCRHSHSRLRHFLDDFGECRFSRLFLGLLLIHSSHDVTTPGASTGQFGSLSPAKVLSEAESDTNSYGKKKEPISCGVMSLPKSLLNRRRISSWVNIDLKSNIGNLLGSADHLCTRGR